MNKLKKICDSFNKVPSIFFGMWFGCFWWIYWKLNNWTWLHIQSLVSFNMWLEKPLRVWLLKGYGWSCSSKYLLILFHLFLFLTVYFLHREHPCSSSMCLCRIMSIMSYSELHFDDVLNGKQEENTVTGSVKGQSKGSAWNCSAKFVHLYVK